MTNKTFPTVCPLIEWFTVLLWSHKHHWHSVRSYISPFYLKRDDVCFFLIMFSSRLNTAYCYITVELKGRGKNCSRSTTVLYAWQDSSWWLFPSPHREWNHLLCGSLLIQVDGSSKSLKLYTYQNDAIMTTNFAKGFPVSFILLNGEECIDVPHLVFKWCLLQIILDLGWFL